METPSPTKEKEPLSPPKIKDSVSEESLERLPSKIKLEIEDARAEVESEAEQAVTKVKEIKDKVQKPAIGVSLFIFLILNVAMFIVGVTTTKDCPKKPIIPIYLAVAGAIGIVTKIIPIANRNKQIAILNRIVYFLFFVEFIWMILGSVWIYSIYEPSYNPYDGNEYCHKTAYLMAFWLLTLHYIYLLILITIPCCIMYACGVAVLCCGKQLLSLGSSD